ncbi:MAG: hypothetical protein J7L53_05395 [Deltaproteobacteria bacterium]|nr:hypothetical protein [Deltaproteobacteria bacterium]
MGEEKKGMAAPIILAVTVFIIGFGLGYFIWGVNREKAPDYKKILQETIDYIATIEHKNMRLLERADTLENEIAMLKKEKEASQVSEDIEGKIKEMEAKIQSLQQENASLRSSATVDQDILQENQILKAKIQRLMEELASMKAHLGAAQDLVEPQTTIGTSNVSPAGEETTTP